MIRMHPELLDTDIFGSARRRAERGGVDVGDYVEFVSDRALRSVGGPTEDDDRNKYEMQLELVGLNGDVPDDLSLTIRTAHEVRNVWAHRNGKADSKLIDKCRHLAYAIGDPVPVTVEALNEYIVALNTYAFIMMNRFRLSNGMDAIECYQADANKFKAGFDRLYPQTSPELLQDRLRSELGDRRG
jgi:hypothetical protein